LFGHGFLSSLRCRERDDPSYCARFGEPLREGVPQIIYHRSRGEKDEKQEKDEFDEKTDTASRNWVVFFGLLIVGVISLRASGTTSGGPAGTGSAILIIAFGLFIVWYVL
jgi:hypothetical protein